MSATTMARDSVVGDVAARLDRLPPSGFHRRLLLIIGVGLLVDGLDVYLTAGVSAALVKQHLTTLHGVALLAMSTALGLAVGGLVSGILADAVGRRVTMRSSILLVVVGSLMAAIAPNFSALVGARALTCLGLGAETVLGYATLSEFLPPHLRGRWLARLGFLANLALPCGLALGYLILPHPNGWRLMFLIPGLLAVGVFLARRRLVESPRWLATRGRGDEAHAVVAMVEASALGGAPMPAFEGRELLASTAVQPLGRGEMASRLIVGMAVNVAIMAAIFGFISWLPTFFAASGRSVAASVGFAFAMSLGGPVGTLLGMLVTDRFERKWSVVGSAMAAAALGAAYAMARDPAAIMVWGFADVTAIYVFGTVGLVGYTPELFPTRQRMRAVGTCATAGRAVTLALPLAIAPLFARYGQVGVVALIATLLLLQSAVVASLGVHTRGRPLRDV